MTISLTRLADAALSSTFLALAAVAIRRQPGEEWRAADGATLRKIGVLTNSPLRVEPYKQPLKVLPHE